MKLLGSLGRGEKNARGAGGGRLCELVVTRGLLWKGADGQCSKEDHQEKFRASETLLQHESDFDEGREGRRRSRARPFDPRFRLTLVCNPGFVCPFVLPVESTTRTKPAIYSVADVLSRQEARRVRRGLFVNCSPRTPAKDWSRRNLLSSSSFCRAALFSPQSIPWIPVAVEKLSSQFRWPRRVFRA